MSFHVEIGYGEYPYHSAVVASISNSCTIYQYVLSMYPRIRVILLSCIHLPVAKHPEIPIREVISPCPAFCCRVLFLCFNCHGRLSQVKPDNDLLSLI